MKLIEKDVYIIEDENKQKPIYGLIFSEDEIIIIDSKDRFLSLKDTLNQYTKKLENKKIIVISYPLNNHTMERKTILITKYLSINNFLNYESFYSKRYFLRSNNNYKNKLFLKVLYNQSIDEMIIFDFKNQVVFFDKKVLKLFNNKSLNKEELKQIVWKVKDGSIKNIVVFNYGIFNNTDFLSMLS